MKTTESVSIRTILLDKQQKLRLPITGIDINKLWNAHWLISKLRDKTITLVDQKLKSSDMPFDPQDLEHQTLFYLTTISPGRITSSNIVDAVNEQYEIIRNRLIATMSYDELSYLFRGLKKFYPDLNIAYIALLKQNVRFYIQIFGH